MVFSCIKIEILYVDHKDRTLSALMIQVLAFPKLCREDFSVTKLLTKSLIAITASSLSYLGRLRGMAQRRICVARPQAR